MNDNPTVAWRIQWYARPNLNAPDRPEGRRDFDTRDEAVAHYESDEVRSRVGPYWRAELQTRPIHPWRTVADTGYAAA